MLMVKTEPCVARPLFGTLCSFDELLPSDSSAECQLIFAAIEMLDDKVNAKVSLEIACRFMRGLRDRSVSRVLLYKTIFEKLLLWCFYCRKKSLLDLTDNDLFEFQSFYLSPPSDWLSRGVRCRFNVTSESVCFNSSWRPFNLRNDPAGRWRQLSRGLNGIIKSVLPNATLRALLPEKAPYESCDTAIPDELIEPAIEKYLNYLFGMRSARGAHEMKLFLFACASYLQVDMRDFNKLRPHLYLNDIFPLSGGGFSWEIDTPYGRYIHTIPESFRRYYKRYSDAVGFNIEESYPPNTLVFQRTIRSGEVTPRTLTCWLSKIPEHPEIDFSPSDLLKALARKSEVTAEKVAYSAKNRTQTQKIDGKKRYQKFQARLEGMKIMPVPVQSLTLLNSRSIAFPLFCLTELNGEIQMNFNHFKVGNALTGVDSSYIFGYVDSLRILLLYIYNHLNKRRLKRLSAAYETLVLWALLVRRKPICLLTEADAVQFFEFCCAPPKSWVSNKSNRVLRDCDPRFPEYNLHWRPFRSSRGHPRVRAALIITHCSQVQNWAIKSDLQNFNVFFKLMLRLWNGCE